MIKPCKDLKTFPYCRSLSAQPQQNLTMCKLISPPLYLINLKSVRLAAESCSREDCSEQKRSTLKRFCLDFSLTESFSLAL